MTSIKSKKMRKICVYTSTRAEYGLLRRLMQQLKESPALHLQLLVSGSHLLRKQGNTLQEIQQDGFKPDRCVDIDLTDDSQEGICQSMGTALSGYGRFFSDFRPDILVLLGDRFEAFCCAAAAQICRIPIAHIHGGETTAGVVDEAFRHSITKMSHLHFPCCEAYRRRLVQLGEVPEHVHNVGALGVENIRNLPLMKKDALEKSLGFPLDGPFFLITFHPVTLENNSAGEQFGQLLLALDQYKGVKCIFTAANADTQGLVINQMQTDYQKRYPDRCLVTPSLGYLRYLSAMKYCTAVVGNSSSGLLEAPALKTPTVNIGDRQQGRVRTKSVKDCTPTKESIIEALNQACEPSFLYELETMEVPFEMPGTSNRIKKILAATDLDGIIKKKFFDLPNQI